MSETSPDDMARRNLLVAALSAGVSTPAIAALAGAAPVGSTTASALSKQSQQILDDAFRSRFDDVYIVASINELRSLRKVSSHTGAVVGGYYAAGDGGGGSFWLDLADNSSADNGATVIVSADGARWKLSHTGSLRAKQFGLRGDGTTDDSPRFAVLNNFANAQPTPFRINFESYTYNFSQGFTTNPARTQYIGDSATWVFTALPDGAAAIWLRGVGTADESQVGNTARRTIAGVKIVTGAQVIGIDIHSDSGTSDSRQINLERIVLEGCLIGIYLGANGWGVKLDKLAFDRCKYGIYEAEDSAENVNFGECNSVQSSFFSGSGLAYYSRNYNSDAHFSMCHFDSAQAVDIARGAKVTISTSHAETAADEGAIFKVDGDSSGLCQTSLVIRDLTLVLPGKVRKTPVFECGSHFPVTGGGLDIDGINIACDADFTLPDNLLVTGRGEVRARKIRSGYRLPPFALAHSLNQFADGGFLSTTFALTDLEPISPAHPPTLVASAFSKSGRAMSMVATGQAYVGATLTKAAKPGQKVFFNFAYLLNELTGGAKLIAEFKVLDRKGNNIRINDSQQFNGTTGWTRYTSRILRSTAMPPGTESVTVSVYVLSAGGTGNALLGDLSLEIID